MRFSVWSFALVSCIGALLWHPAVAAQTVAGGDKWAAEPLVINRIDQVYRLEADGTGFHEKTVVAHIQAESSLKQLAVISVGFAANSEKAAWVYARLRHQDGTVTETPVDTAIEMAEPVTREAPFYSDLKELQLPLKDLRVGDQLEWKVRVTRTKAEAAGESWGQEMFQRTGVVLAETLKLDVPKDAAVTVWSPKQRAAETVEGERRVYAWTASHAEPTVGVEAEARNEAEKKRVRTAEEEVELREGKVPDVAWTTFKNWEAVGAWYRALEGERMVPDAEVKAKVAQLTAGKTTELAKVQAVYTYVATQIHYVGVAFGVGRYQPHSAGDVLGNQYGDCKDKHTLLAAMLGALGYAADAVLMGVEIRFNREVPSPQSFNHLMTRVKVEGRDVWLDTTAEVAPFGMLLYETRDHEGLVIPATGAAKVMRTPAEIPFGAQDTWESKGTLDAEGTSESKVTMRFRGDSEILMRSVVRQVSAAQYDQLAQQLCAGMGYAGTANHMAVGRPEDTTVPMEVSFDYKRVKGGDWGNLRVLPQVAPVQLPRPDAKEPPVADLALGMRRVEVSTAEMGVPAGWGVELPEAVHQKSEWATVDETYRFAKGVLYTERRVEVLKERVAQAEWKAYSKFAEKADLGVDQFVQLVRHGRPSVSEGSDGEASSDVSVKTLVQQASDALQHEHNPLKAERLLDQVKAKSPDLPGLWTSYAGAALMRGEMTEAVADLRKELTLHAGSVQVYPMLVRVELAASKRKEAMESLRQWGAADPADDRPGIQLAGLQMEDGKYAEAAATAKATALLTPRGDKPSDELLLLLGRAQMKAGLQEEGHETLLRLLKETETAGMMNDAAYELADAGMELVLAEQTTRRALTEMETASRSWTLDESPLTLRQKTLQLQATWDTMGWVLFREGKVTAAEGYVKASWLGRQTPEVGDHLAEIALKRGDKNAAVTYLELGAASAQQYDQLGVRKAGGAKENAMEARAAQLKKQGARALNDDAVGGIQRLRKIPLGAGADGVAEYRVLVSSEGVARAEPVEDKTVPDALEKLKRGRLSELVPAGSNGVVALFGYVNCHQGQCEFIVSP